MLKGGRQEIKGVDSSLLKLWNLHFVEQIVDFKS